MRNLMYVLTVMAVIGLGFWAYRENYRTKAELDDVHRLQSELAILRESLGVLHAEWAYLNRPDRLRELADINFDRLQLLPLVPEQFGAVDQVAYPAPDVVLPDSGDLAAPIDTSAALKAAIAQPETQP